MANYSSYHQSFLRHGMHKASNYCIITKVITPRSLKNDAWFVTNWPWGEPGCSDLNNKISGSLKFFGSIP